MKIKKLDEEITYKQMTTQHTFEINGKEVRVLYWTRQSAEDPTGDDADTEVLDEEELSEEELEALGEYMTENLDLKVGEEWDTDTCVACGEIQDEDGRCKCTNGDGK